MTTATEQSHLVKRVEEIESATVRFAGDSGDGMQLVGEQFTTATVVFGNDISTLPDYPAEIRAPAGTLAGVSGFQINFSSQEVHTPGDRIDALFALNPAALKVNLPDLRFGGVIVADADAFTKENLEKVGYKSNPLEDDSLREYKVVSIPLSDMNFKAVEGLGLDRKTANRCKNFFALGLAFWLYDRPMEPTIRWVQQKFVKRPAIMDANLRTLKAGYHFGETAEIFTSSYRINRAVIPPGTYRKISGNEGIAMGLVAAAKLANKPLFYASYPITPASDILHSLSAKKNYGVVTFQAEDEIAAMCAVIGAAYGGSLAVTGTSGPGVALKSEAIGLAVMTELPAVIVNVQRGGPSTGLPTKTEQADLFQAIFGRNGECPVPVVAAATPADCFETAIEACRIALQFMTPVILLSDGYLANGSEPWRIPDIDSLPKIDVNYHTNKYNFQPYSRNERLGRPWAVPGTPELQHRIGGLEKQHITGNVNYDPDNHEYMVKLRDEKIHGIQEDIPPLEINGDATGDLLVLGWGGAYGSIMTAVEKARREKRSVSSAHLRYLNPFPKNLENVLSGFKKILIPELNLGQLRFIIRSRFLIDSEGLNKIKGKPFQVNEIYEKIVDLLEN
ncbi:MAG: 2-oxoacid:acceptor oxidoreductase subunit alpha [Candidatus Omnitrophota bacterium]|jgi:2-oxoglutarate ferredoxin oxidoreductase subunit alpha|nr:MAG: 2-oxoacid:acceptor oxidoreductase subunit alpha [Candidatus Omnitrophota bacterium]